MEHNLIPLPINELLDKQFFIPHYQRGYRWTEQQVKQLLDDIDSFLPREIHGKPEERTFYCLQPIVAKPLDNETKQKYNLTGEWYEIIDGQQRLTTIYIILHYINQKWLGEDKLPQFKLNYETRQGCAAFLSELKVNADDTVDIDKGNIDFYHISMALQTVRQWQLNYKEEKGKAINTALFQSTFVAYSKIIWYQVSRAEDSRRLFERLNLGKIPLTNAELTKALFLSSESFKELSDEDRRIKQYEIARLWDEIEHKLNVPDLKFWSFITNKKRGLYETRIELILDLISGKTDDEKDPFYTFLYLTEKLKKQGGLATVWDDIEQFYFTLQEWFKDRDYYHKVGYLITSRHFASYKGVDLGLLVKDSMQKKKTEFMEQIDAHIRESVKFELSELRYEMHKSQMFNALLLFNVETNRLSDAITEYYPFKQHKDNLWSLEHIHARKSDNFDKTKKDSWRSWLSLHEALLKEKLESDQFNPEAIQNALDDIARYNTNLITWERFEVIFKKVNDLFTSGHESMDNDSEGISNIALLSQPDNASLNNSVFEIKRREVIRLDREGHFIPVCTRRCFMKYYNKNEHPASNYFWTLADRESYYNELHEGLKTYLSENFIGEESNGNE